MDVRFRRQAICSGGLDRHPPAHRRWRWPRATVQATPSARCRLLPCTGCPRDGATACLAAEALRRLGGGQVKGEWQVAAAMRSQWNSVDKNSRQVIYGLKVQPYPAASPGGWKTDTPAVPERLVGLKGFAYSRKRAFNRIRYDNLPIELCRNFIRDAWPRPGLPYGVVPGPIQTKPVPADKQGPRIFRQRGRAVKSLAPSRRNHLANRITPSVPNQE